MSYGYRQYRDTAHRWTQIGVGLISVIAGLILIVCVTAPMYVSSMLKDAGLSAAISHRFMDTVFDSTNMFGKTSTRNVLIYKYLDRVIDVTV